MKRCPKCQAEYPEGFEFCGNEGEKLAVVEPVAEAALSAEQETDPLVGTLLDGKYKVERKLGSGGMGTVYVARHRIINKQVAIKVFTPEPNSDDSMAERFQQEAEAAARIRHPSIVAVNDFGETDKGLLYIVMEYVDGISLRELIKKELRLAPERVVSLGCQICAGIAVAHGAGIIHRDLKPENVLIEMIDGRETARVFDFGIAKLLDRAGLTRAGSVLGTPVYMSPEQATAQPVDNRSDLYSLGVILYELLSGQPPFTGAKPQQVLVKHVIEMPKPLSSLRPGLPEPLARAIMRALEKSPDDRHQTALDFANALAGSKAS